MYIAPTEVIAPFHLACRSVLAINSVRYFFVWRWLGNVGGKGARPTDAMAHACLATIIDQVVGYDLTTRLIMLKAHHLHFGLVSDSFQRSSVSCSFPSRDHRSHRAQEGTLLRFSCPDSDTCRNNPNAYRSWAVDLWHPRFWLIPSRSVKWVSLSKIRARMSRH